MTTPNFKDKTIWTGDNLHILWGMNSDALTLSTSTRPTTQREAGQDEPYRTSA